MDFSTLIALKQSDFLDIIKNHPLDYEKFCEIRD